MQAEEVALMQGSDQERSGKSDFRAKYIISEGPIGQP
jgi:hypothetical protein